jgi:uncharacterized protein YqjF (DUF2071 family)
MEKKLNKFLTARWEYLMMANYEVNPDILIPYLPKGVEIDFFNQKTYLSVVGFMFLDTKVLGIPVPFHTNFEEVNLRFYVKYFDEKIQEWKRGVVFIKEIVPKIAIAKVARWVYGENYIATQMRHQITATTQELKVEYEWKVNQKWHKIGVTAHHLPQEIQPQSDEEFITEHYWGYTQLKNATAQYQVEHPRWQIFNIKNHQIEVDFEQVYGNPFADYLYQKPTSVLLAKGSGIVVRKAEKIKF